MSDLKDKVGASVTLIVLVVIGIAALCLVLRFAGWMLGMFFGGVFRLLIVAGVVWLGYQIYLRLKPGR
ncbi:hypothetical protein QJ043_03490 [Olsenella sp. YH-ols2217]|uniref:Uncharacterized protein n=1 Tax=Kribbibacterium absianum TaxID=3044210 RepID=A0ABT6ZKT8_9ACTN|nr:MULTISPECIES: hypothetical protein [unclassified Olsenella]MDJ1122710.1 hypothetical protein [Olsenella sp. YH-ols2216]MDJ1129148.1 hypothetical protein [Olsenella sp. YH-ols2217]